MDRNRILELAIETLERQKKEVQAEIDKIRSELKGSGTQSAQKKKVPAKTGKKRSMSTAQRKLRSEKMKQYWAAKKRKTKGKR